MTLKRLLMLTVCPVLLLFLIVALFVLIHFTQPPCTCKEVINILPQHATRAYVTYQCTDNTINVGSYHWSNDFTCAGKTYHVGDYIPGYGTKQF